MAPRDEPPPANGSGRLSPAVATVLCIWIFALTAVFLLLSAPAAWLGVVERAWPQVAELKSAVRSLFHRDSRF